MKMRRVIVLSFALVLLASLPLAAQLKGMSLGGATGLVGVPNARLGWETTDVGLDVGYHAIIVDGGDVSHLPKATVSLFQMLEAGLTYDRQDDTGENNDFLINAKFQLPIDRASAIAVGANIQILETAGNKDNVYQLYLASTYPGDFFNMPAETTFVVGYTFGDLVSGDDIDFGMGFDLLLFPEVLKGYVHWINDFANFSYSITPSGANASFRGVFNTGARINLSANPKLAKYKATIDVIVADALDDDRSFVLGASFGLGLK
jgi:hypothetical protein